MVRNMNEIEIKANMSFFLAWCKHGEAEIRGLKFVQWCLFYSCMSVSVLFTVVAHVFPLLHVFGNFGR